MKQIFLLFALAFSLHSVAQKTKSFTSNFQVSEETLATFNIPYRIAVIDPKEKGVSSGLVTIIDLKDNTTFLKLKITYLKTVKDEDGNTTYWYTLYDNIKFNVFKIQHYASPMLSQQGKRYKNLLIFSLYDENDVRVNDLGFLSNPLK